MVRFYLAQDTCIYWVCGKLCVQVHVLKNALNALCPPRVPEIHIARLLAAVPTSGTFQSVKSTPAETVLGLSLEGNRVG